MSMDPHNPEEAHLPSAPPVSNAEIATSDSGGNRMLFIGIAAGVVLYALALAGSLAFGTEEQGYWSLWLISGMVLVSVVLLIVGVVLVSIQKTRKLGAGLLISVAVGLFVDGGTCIALLMGGV